MQKQKNIKALIAICALVSLIWTACKKDKSDEPVPITGQTRPVTTTSNAYVTDLFEFNPAPGQFTNTSLGDTVAAKGTLKTDQGLVSLGAWGATSL